MQKKRTADGIGGGSLKPLRGITMADLDRALALPEGAAAKAIRLHNAYFDRVRTRIAEILGHDPWKF